VKLPAPITPRCHRVVNQAQAEGGGQGRAHGLRSTWANCRNSDAAHPLGPQGASRAPVSSGSIWPSTSRASGPRGLTLPIDSPPEAVSRQGQGQAVDGAVDAAVDGTSGRGVGIQEDRQKGMPLSGQLSGVAE